MGYKVGDVLTFIGAQYVRASQVQVTAAGAAGAVTSITLPNRTTSYYLGVYTVATVKPYFGQRWQRHRRSFEYHMKCSHRLAHSFLLLITMFSVLGGL